MDSIQVTKHFNSDELRTSALFPETAEKIELTQKDLNNYYYLIAPTLEPERVHSDTITHILQGKRSEELRQLLLTVPSLSPSPTSKHHCIGPYDCAIDCQKHVYIVVGGKRIIDIIQSRIATICAFFWIINNCPYSFGTIYYQSPGESIIIEGEKRDKIGYFHIDSITPDKPVGVNYIRR